MKNYQLQKDAVVANFYLALDEARQLLCDVSSGNKIELKNNGVTFSMIDPMSDGDLDLSDVVSIENGVIELDNGTEAHVNDFTSLTDLIGLIETIDE